MDSRAAVAVILAVGVVLVLLSGTSFRFIWSPVTQPMTSPEAAGMWKDLVLVILGVLAGYISGRDK